MDSLKDRLVFMKDLEEFIENSQHTLDRVYHEFGWKEKDATKISSNVCYSECNKNEFSEEPLLPDPLPQSFVNSKTRLILDCELQKNILQSRENEKTIDSSVGMLQPPKASGEYLANFSREERLAFHNHVLATTTFIDPPPEIMIPDEIESTKNQSTSSLSLIESKKLERDMKRRRQAYRTKVSTKNKTQTEVTREIIANMMEVLEPKKEEKQLSGHHDRKERDNYENGKDRNGTSRYKDKEKEEEKQLFDQHVRKERDNYENRKDRNGTSRYEDRKNLTFDRNKNKHNRDYQMYTKSKYPRSQSRERESSRERGYKRDRRSRSRDRKNNYQSVCKDRYSKEISSSVSKEKNKTLGSTRREEFASKYEFDDPKMGGKTNEDVNIHKESEKNSLIDTYIKKEKHSDQSANERLSSDSENERKKDTRLSKSSYVLNKKGRINSINHESKDNVCYLSEGELVSSDSENNTNIRKISKKHKKKKKHKGHKRRHKERKS